VRVIFPAAMKGRTVIAAVVALAAVAAVLAIAIDGEEKQTGRVSEVPGRPTVEVISPRNGSRQVSRAVVVKVAIDNFRLAPAEFGEAPQLGEGHLRFSLNRVPNCVEPEKLERAINSPLGSGRLIGRSFDYSPFSGPNGLLAERIGSAGLYSPATKPEIYYHRLPPGFYRLVITLAQNNGASTPFHAVTNFEVLPDPRNPGTPHTEEECEGKVSSAEAAEAIE
jgi:hypothetical protein